MALRFIFTQSIAKKTLDAIKKKRKDFRIMFSSTFGVMIYTSTQEIKAYNDRCEYSFLATVDALCPPKTGQGIALKDDQKELVKYATWEQSGRHHFLSTMDEKDISAVVSGTTIMFLAYPFFDKEKIMSA